MHAEQSGQDHPGDHTAHSLIQASWPRRWPGVVVLMFALAVLAIDATALNFAIPAITADLRPTAPEMLWIVDIYAFALAALLVTMGNVGDRFGRRNVLLWGVAFFGISSVAAGLATTPLILIIARFIQGAAGACLMPSTLSLISAMFLDPAERAKAVSIWVATYSAAAAAGPLLGGFLLNHFHWGAIFFINVPLCLIVILGGLVYLPKSRASDPPALDVPGAVLSIISLLALVYVMKILPHNGPSLLLGAIAALGVGATVLLLRHLRQADNPVIDLELLKDARFRTIVTINGASMFLYLGVLFFLAQFLQSVAGYSITAAAWLMVPGLVLVVVSTLITGRIMTRYSTRMLLLVALVGAAAGCGLLALGAWHEHGIALAVAFVFLNCSLGMIDPISNAFILESAPAERAGAAASLSETGYELGGALGTAVMGSVLMGVFAHQLPAQLPDQAGQSLTEALELAAPLGLVDAVDLAFSQGVVAACLVGIVASIAMFAAVVRNVQ